MTLVLPALIVIAAAAFRGVTGYGFALLAALGLAHAFAPETATAIILACDLLITALILADSRAAEIDWPFLGRLLGIGALGAAAGVALAGALDAETARLAVSLVVAAAALIAMMRRPPAWLAGGGAGLAAAALTGVLLAAFAVGGPVIAAWVLASGAAPARARANLAVFFGAVDGLSLLIRIGAGLVPAEALAPMAVALPLTLLGYGGGRWAFRRLSVPAWRRVSALGLLGIAIGGGVQALALALALG